MCIQSFLYHGHRVRLWAYNKIKNLPTSSAYTQSSSGFEVMDANLIIPKERVFKHKNSYAAFSDYFRWKLMVEIGGYYVDTDVVCLKKFEFDQDFLIGWENEGVLLTPTVLKVSKGHELAKEMLFCAEHPFKIRPYDDGYMKKQKVRKRFYFINRPKAIGWGMTAGPIAITRAYKYLENKLNINPVPRNVFYSVKPEQWRDIIEENKLTLSSLPSEAIGLHLWNNYWAKDGINKNKMFSSNSLIGELFNKYYKE